MEKNEAMEDLKTHRDAWRAALKFMKAHATYDPPEIDDRIYWQHELEVFDRTFAVLCDPQ